MSNDATAPGDAPSLAEKLDRLTESNAALEERIARVERELEQMAGRIALAEKAHTGRVEQERILPTEQDVQRRQLLSRVRRLTTE